MLKACLLLTLLGACGCKRDKTASALPRKGEAFIVLKSDDIIYMADMEIRFLNSGFKAAFEKWKQDFDSASGDGLRDASRSNSPLRSIQSSMDSKIADVLSQTNQAKQSHDEVLKEIISSLKSKLSSLTFSIASIERDRRVRRDFSFDQEFFEQKTKAKQLSDRISSLEANGDEAKAATEAEIQSRIESITAQAKELKQDKDRLIAKELAEIIRRLQVKFTPEFYNVLLNSSIGVSRSNSKGQFNVPADAVYIFAEHERNNGERLVWLLQVNEVTAEITLSNSNMTPDRDEFWMYKVSLK